MTPSENRTTAESPLISVVIPAYNAETTIGSCIRALCNQTLSLPYEIIVVDDGSDDRTATIAQASGATVIRTSRARPAAARNAGIAAARGSIICFTDADCEATAEWLVEITNPLSDPHVTAAKGTYATHQRSLVARFVQLEYEDKYDLMARAASIDFIDTYSAAYRASVLNEIGGFDPRFIYLEDQELSFRLAALEKVMVFQPSAIVYHTHVDNLKEYLKKKFTIGYWKTQVVRRFPERAVRDSHTPQVMKLQMLLAALLLLSLATLLFSAVIQWPWGITAASISAAIVFLLFLATTIPFVAKAWSKDRPVALVSPVLLFARALGLGAGTLWGIVAPPREVLD